MRGPTPPEARVTSVSGDPRGAGRQPLPSAPVSPLLNHLLDCRESSDGGGSGDAGGEFVPTADSLLRAEAVRARLDGEVESAEDWYRQAGILSREAESVIAEHEFQPDSNLIYHNDRERQHIRRRLLRRDLIEEAPDG